MYNPAGFNPSGLGMDPNLGDPRRQENLPGSFATQGQAVSAPYAEANMVAASNTNPMNAVSQEPGKNFLQGYLQKSAPELGQRADFNLLNPSTWFEAFRAKEAAGRGELNIDEKRSSPILTRIYRGHENLEAAKRRARGY